MISLKQILSTWSLVEELIKQSKSHTAAIYLITLLLHPESFEEGSAAEENLMLCLSPFSENKLKNATFPPYLRQEEARCRVKAASILVHEAEKLMDNQNGSDHFQSSALVEEYLKLAALLLSALFSLPRRSAILSSEETQSIEPSSSLPESREVDALSVSGIVGPSNKYKGAMFAEVKPRRSRVKRFGTNLGVPWLEEESVYFFNPSLLCGLAWDRASFALQTKQKTSFGYSKNKEQQENLIIEDDLDLVFFHRSDCVGQPTSSSALSPTLLPQTIPFAFLLHSFLVLSKLFLLRGNLTAALDVLEAAEKRWDAVFIPSQFEKEKSSLAKELMARGTRCFQRAQERTESLCFVSPLWSHVLNLLWSHERLTTRLLLEEKKSHVLFCVLRSLSRPVASFFCSSSNMGDSLDAKAIFTRQKDAHVCLEKLVEDTWVCRTLDQWLHEMKEFWIIPEDTETSNFSTKLPSTTQSEMSHSTETVPQSNPTSFPSFCSSFEKDESAFRTHLRFIPSQKVSALLKNSRVSCTCSTAPLYVLCSSLVIQCIGAKEMAQSSINGFQDDSSMEIRHLLLACRGWLDPMCTSSWFIYSLEGDAEKNKDHESVVAVTSCDVHPLLRRIAFSHGYAHVLALSLLPVKNNIGEEERTSEDRDKSGKSRKRFRNSSRSSKYLEALLTVKECAKIGLSSRKESGDTVFDRVKETISLPPRDSSNQDKNTVHEMILEGSLSTLPYSSAPDEFDLLQQLLDVSGYTTFSTLSPSSVNTVFCEGEHWTSASWRRIVKEYYQFTRAASFPPCSPFFLPLSEIIERCTTLLKEIEVEMLLLSGSKGMTGSKPQIAEISSTCGKGPEQTDGKETREELLGSGTAYSETQSLLVPFQLVPFTRVETLSARGQTVHGCRAERAALSFLLSLKTCLHLQLASFSLHRRHLVECIHSLMDWKQAVQVFAAPLTPLRVYGHLMVAVLAMHIGLFDLPDSHSPPSLLVSRSVVEVIRERRAALRLESLSRIVASSGEEEEVASLVGLPYYHLLAAEAVAIGATDNGHQKSAFYAASLSTSPAPSFLLRLQLLKLFAIYLTSSTRARVTLRRQSGSSVSTGSGVEQHRLSQSSLLIDDPLPYAPRHPSMTTCGDLEVANHPDYASQKICRDVFRAKMDTLLEDLRKTCEWEKREDVENAKVSDASNSSPHLPESSGMGNLSSIASFCNDAWCTSNRCLLHLFHGLYALSEERDPFLARQSFQRALDVLTESAIENHLNIAPELSSFGNIQAVSTPTAVKCSLFNETVALLQTAIKDPALRTGIPQMHSGDLSNAHTAEAALCDENYQFDRVLKATMLQLTSCASLPIEPRVTNMVDHEKTEKLQRRWKSTLFHLLGAGHGVASAALIEKNSNGSNFKVLHDLMTFLPEFEDYSSPKQL